MHFAACSPVVVSVCVCTSYKPSPVRIVRICANASCVASNGSLPTQPRGEVDGTRVGRSDDGDETDGGAIGPRRGGVLRVPRQAAVAQRPPGAAGAPCTPPGSAATCRLRSQVCCVSIPKVELTSNDDHLKCSIQYKLFSAQNEKVVVDFIINGKLGSEAGVYSARGMASAILPTGVSAVRRG